MALNLKTLGTRSISAVVFVIILLSAVYFSYFSFITFFLLVALMALNEFYNLSEKMNAMPFRILGLILGFIIFISISNGITNILSAPQINKFLTAILILAPFIIALKFLFTNSELVFNSFVYTLGGIIYCIIPFSLLITIPVNLGVQLTIETVGDNYEFFRVMGIIFLIWANDTFAYLGGSLVGKNKMYERVSPGKTWEGTLIGVFCTIGIGFVLNINHTFESSFIWPAVALIVSVFGTMGDLVESLMKRKAGVKDSGNIMPGHGGILDRFDSLLFVSPFVFVFLRLAGY